MKQSEDHKMILSASSSIMEGLERLNQNAADITPNPVLFIVDSVQKLVGTVTDGDIRRRLLRDGSVNGRITECMNTGFRFLRGSRFDLAEAEKLKKLQIRFVPVLTAEDTIEKILDLNEYKAFLPIEAVLMAGGEGQRLRPFTLTTPKPLLQIGEKAIIEHNIDRLLKYGVNRIFISVRYLKEQIVQYLGDGEDRGVSIEYIYEDVPLGTIGALSKTKDFKADNILVMNSDLLTNIDFADFYSFFLDSGADFLIASVPFNVSVPYAVIDTDSDHNILSLQEKPILTYFSNAGIYLFRKEIQKLIPADRKFDATDLIEELIAKGMKVKSYPLTNYWLDIGRMEDYIKAQDDIKHLVL